VSVSDRLKQVPAGRGSGAWPQWVRGNAARYFALFRRKPRASAMPMWRTPYRVGLAAIVVVAVTAETMIAVDAWAVTLVRRMPEWLITTFDHLTDLGKSVWLLVPIAVALGAIALFASPTLPRMSQRLLAAIAVRLGFLFIAVGLPGLVFTIAKRLVGRARPLVEGSADPFSYRPLGWSVEYASLPSGHAIDAFAIAIAVGALWPRARPLLWTYAVLIALSRVVLTAHFPSDVIAGAVVGVVGVLLVRDWFATRALAFLIGADGIVRPLPGPSPARIKRVVRHATASAKS
jgi:membrane-associated phospholipid phosphatase